jgi:hypothetical protein
MFFVAGLESTRTTGFSENESHGQTPLPLQRVQTTGRPGIYCGGSALRSWQTLRRLSDLIRVWVRKLRLGHLMRMRMQPEADCKTGHIYEDTP